MPSAACGCFPRWATVRPPTVCPMLCCSKAISIARRSNMPLPPLVQRHESLRTTFIAVDEELAPRYSPSRHPPALLRRPHRGHPARRNEPANSPAGCPGPSSISIRPPDPVLSPETRPEPPRPALQHAPHHFRWLEHRRPRARVCPPSITPFYKPEGSSPSPLCRIQYRDFACWQNSLLE